MATTLEDLAQLLTGRAAPQHKYTFEEYLNWSGTERVEWVDGEIVTMAPASIRHELLFSFLLTTLNLYTKRHNLGRVMGSDVAMKLSAQRRGCEPDILFVLQERLNLFRANYLDGRADLAIEIISPESIGRDRGEKFLEYEAAGIPEYWLLDPQRQEAEFYRLHANGHYRLVNIGDDGIFRSEVITGFWLRITWLWELPNELDVLRELGVI